MDSLEKTKIQETQNGNIFYTTAVNNYWIKNSSLHN